MVGVDFSSLAIDAARRKLRDHGDVPVSFIAADVTRFEDAGIQGPFDFILDIGCFHGVPRRCRGAYVREVSTLSRSGATLLMFAFGPKDLLGRHRTREREIRRRFANTFELTGVELGTKPLVAAWFTLRRR